MMPAALGLPIEEILEQIAVEREVATRSASTKACWEPSWRCSSASTTTTRRLRPAAVQAARHFDRHTLNTCLSAALRWLNGNAA
jgi:hypothetical protein